MMSGVRERSNLNSSLELNSRPLIGSLYLACSRERSISGPVAVCDRHILTTRPEMSAYFLAGFKGGGASRLQTIESANQREGGGDGEVERVLTCGITRLPG